jgi:alkaline phosphatase D
MAPPVDEHPFSRRRFLLGAGAAGLASATPSLVRPAIASASPAVRETAPRTASAPTVDGTPEQIHLTWGADPARSVVVSWASLAPSQRARVRYRRVGGGPGGGGEVGLPAVQRTYTVRPCSPTTPR